MTRKDLLQQRDRAAESARALETCIRVSRLEPATLRNLETALAYELARIDKLDAAILNA